MTLERHLVVIGYAYPITTRWHSWAVSKKIAASLDFISRTSVIKFAIAELAKQVLGKRFIKC